MSPHSQTSVDLGGVLGLIERKLRNVIASRMKSPHYTRSYIEGMSIHRIVHGLREAEGGAPYGGLVYFGLLALFLGPISLAGVLETLTIYQEEYQRDEQTLVMPVRTHSLDNLHPAPGLIGKPL